MAPVRVESWCAVRSGIRLPYVATRSTPLPTAITIIGNQASAYRRIMDTGGDKGAPRRLSRNGLLHACWSTFAVPGYFVVNEYGMAELSSQFYDNVIAERFAGRHCARCKVGPHWSRRASTSSFSFRKPQFMRPLVPPPRSATS